MALEGQVQFGKDLLGRLCRQLRQPVDLRPQPGELATLAGLADRVAASPAPLVERDVPQQAGAARPPAERARLLRSGVQPRPMAPMHAGQSIWSMGTDTTEIRTGRHCVLALHAHLVFVTKYRGDVLRAEHLDAIERIVRAVCADCGAELREFNRESDHVHLLVTYPPKVALASLVNFLKGVLFRLLRRDFPDLERRSWRGHLWSASYFAGSVGGAPLGVVRRYIE